MSTATNAQLLAADPSHSAWVSANAGTGKTHVLIDRITRLLLRGTRAEKILCLTFTKAAAAEMENRLNDRLGEWAAAKPADLKHKLRSLLDREPTDKEYARGQRLFAEIIDAPEGLKIKTIHAFCESLLGRFSLEAQVAPNFQVMDERRAAELRMESKNQILHLSLNHTPTALTHAMSHIAGLVDENGFARIIAELDLSRGRLADITNSHGNLDSLICSTRKILGLSPGTTRNDIIKSASNNTAIDRNALVLACQVLTSGSPNEQERANKIRTWLEANSSTRQIQFLEDYVPIFLTKKWLPRAPKGLITQNLAKSEPNTLSTLLEEQARIYEIAETLKGVAIAENTAAVLVIGDALFNTYENLKSTRGLIDYDDLISKAAALLSDKAGASWVHYKLDGGIDHILVDEAQDTSPAQWKVISRLAGDFFSGVGRIDPENFSLGRTIFAVGDEKQSIYSFQGADPAQFAIIGAEFSAKIEAARQNWCSLEMEKSWRSTPPILSVVDHVFRTPEASDGLTWAENSKISHQTTRQEDAGRVEWWPMISASDAIETDPWDAPVDQIPGDDPRIQLSETIAETIKNWLTSGEILESRGRAITAGDIMILVRTRGAFADEMVRALKDRSVPVAGSDRMILTEYLAVMDLLALGRFALLPNDDLNTATVLKGPFVGLSETQLFNLAHERTGSIWGELNRLGPSDANYGQTLDKLRKILAAADFLPPYEFFSSTLTTGGRQSMFARLGPEAADPVDEFMALALDFERDHTPSLEGFLHWIQTGQSEVKRDLEQAGNAVRIMTVHGAKGLQAPIVFLTDNGLLPARQLQDSLRWLPLEDRKDIVLWPAYQDNEVACTRAAAEKRLKETEREYRRLLYVAMTRAEDRLYMTGWQGKRKPEDTCWHRLVEAGLRSTGEAIEFPIAGSIGLRLETSQKFMSTNTSKPSVVDPVTKDLPEWAYQEAAKEPSPALPLRPSHMKDEPLMASPINNNGDGFKRGRIIHSLLQTLPDLPQDARTKALSVYLAAPTHGLSVANQADICSEVLSVLNHPECQHLFGKDSRAEVSLVGDVGTTKPCIISGQIDRILVTPDMVTVVDFKGNQSPPNKETDVAPVYLRQMAAYRASLRSIYPDRKITTILLWTFGPKIMPLSDKILDDHAP